MRAVGFQKLNWLPKASSRQKLSNKFILPALWIGTFFIQETPDSLGCLLPTRSPSCHSLLLMEAPIPDPPCSQQNVCPRLNYFFGRAHGMQKFPGQGSNPHHSSDYTGSPTCYTTRKLPGLNFFELLLR